MSVKGCAVAGCDRKHKAKGFCDTHHAAFQRHGDPLGGSDRTPPGALLDWLRQHVQHDADDCIEWPFARYPHGYGHITYEGLDTSAHRVMCRLAHGEPASPDLDAAHSCHNRPCCNPRHLRWATRIENMADKVEAGTDGVGEKNAGALVTEADVREIRRLRGAVEQKVLAQRFGITKSNVSAIQLRKSWRHI